MTNLQKIERDACVLPLEDRAALVAYLLNTFDLPGYDVSDEEVVRREIEMESGGEPGITHTELLHKLGRSGST